MVKQWKPNFLFKKELIDFEIHSDYIFIHELDDFGIYSFVDYQLISKLGTNFYSYFIYKNKILASKRSGREIFVYDDKGQLLTEVGRFINIGKHFEYKNKMLIKTMYQVMNDKWYWTELDLETLKTKQIKYPDIEKKGFGIQSLVNDNLIIHDPRKNVAVPWVGAINAYSGEKIWEYPLKKLNYRTDFLYDQKSYPSFMYLENYIFSVDDFFFSINSNSGDILWKRKITSNVLPYKNEGFEIDVYGDYVVYDLDTGDEKKRIKNWTDHDFWKNDIIHWQKTIPNNINIYDEYFIIASINHLTFYHKENAELLLRLEFKGLTGWGRGFIKKQYDIRGGKLFLMVRKKEDYPMELHVFEVDPFDDKGINRVIDFEN